MEQSNSLELKNANQQLKDFSEVYLRKIKSEISRLPSSLDIKTFTYFSIDENGKSSIFTSNIDSLYDYYEMNVHLIDPVVKHPLEMIEGGYLLSDFKSDDHLQWLNKQKKSYSYSDYFTIIQNEKKLFRGFNFSFGKNNKNIPSSLFNYSKELKMFVEYFKIKYKKEIKTLEENAFKILYLSQKQKGPANQLTFCEKSVAELLSLGFTVKEIAEIHSLSPRTIESKLINIKNKKNVRTNHELRMIALPHFNLG